MTEARKNHYSMETTRQSKISRLVQKELGGIFQRESILPGVMISVTHVNVSSDLGMARVFISLFPSDDKAEDLKKVKERAQELRFMLGKEVSKQLRHVPELYFYLDDTMDKAEEIDKLLKN